MSYLMTEELIKELLQKQANDIVKNFPVANPPEGFKWKAILEVTFLKMESLGIISG